MTIEMEMQLPMVTWPAALHLILDQKEEMRPSMWSVGEDSIRQPLSKGLPPEKLQDVFLWADACTYDVGRSKAAERITIFAISPNWEELDALLFKLSNLDVEFGYACTPDERKHRNRVTRKMDYGLDEAWVGRDFSRYLPGLYWRTVVPVELQKKLGISLEGFRGATSDIELQSNRNWVLRLYEKPDDWSEQVQRVDDWCMHTAGCFSKVSAVNALAKAQNFMEASAAIAEWR